MRVLLLSWHFRDGTSEGLCAARVAEALAARGHQLTVLARGPETSAGDSDRSSATLSVERVEEPAAGLRWWRYWNRNSRRSPVDRGLSALLNLRRFANAQQWAWIDAAATRASAMIDTARADGEPFDVLFSRLNPQVSHQAALLVKRRQQSRQAALPWCAYFSDPWPHFLYPPPFAYGAGPLARRRGLSVLRQLYAEASTLMFPSRRLADYMTDHARVGGDRRAMESARERTFVVPHPGPVQLSVTQTPEAPEVLEIDAIGNGCIQDEESDKKLRLRHAGFLMRERNVDALMTALRLLPEAVRSDFAVEFVGRFGHDGLPDVEGLEDVVSFRPAMSPEGAWQWMQRASVALLVESDFEEGIFLPSKLSDYAALPHPILALSPAVGTVADFLAKGGGLRTDPTDAEQISKSLGELHRLWSSGELSAIAPKQEFAEQFSPASVASEVEKALQAAIDAR